MAKLDQTSYTSLASDATLIIQVKLAFAVGWHNARRNSDVIKLKLTCIWDFGWLPISCLVGTRLGAIKALCSRSAQDALPCKSKVQKVLELRYI
jgi:hypothetical protein